MSMNPELRVRSPRFWHLAAQMARWSRRLSTASTALAAAVLAALALVAVFGSTSADQLREPAGNVAITVLFVIPAGIILRRMELAFTGYERQVSSQ